jgi:hypothetical protein
MKHRDAWPIAIRSTRAIRTSSSPKSPRPAANPLPGRTCPMSLTPVDLPRERFAAPVVGSEGSTRTQGTAQIASLENSGSGGEYQPVCG